MAATRANGRPAVLEAAAILASVPVSRSNTILARRLEDAVWRAVWDALPADMATKDVAAVAGAAQRAASEALSQFHERGV